MFFRVISVIDRLPQALDRVTNSGSTEIDIGHGSECRLLCRFLGRLHDAAIHARRRQASEKRQGTKSR
jgi:hypothetical protein